MLDASHDSRDAAEPTGGTSLTATSPQGLTMSSAPRDGRPADGETHTVAAGPTPFEQARETFVALATAAHLIEPPADGTDSDAAGTRVTLRRPTEMMLRALRTLLSGSDEPIAASTSYALERHGFVTRTPEGLPVYIVTERGHDAVRRATPAHDAGGDATRTPSPPAVPIPEPVETTPARTDVQREQESLLATYTRNLLSSPYVKQLRERRKALQAEALLLRAENESLRAEIARLRAPSDAACDALLDRLDTIATNVSLQDWGLPTGNPTALADMRAAIRAARADA